MIPIDDAAWRPTMGWAFLPFALVSVLHVIALAVSASVIAGPTKLLLMPALAAAVIWCRRSSWRSGATALLLVAIALSWLGDGAGVIFPFLPELPVMLACFGLAHLAYIWLFTRRLPHGRFPTWSLVYVLWWAVLLVVLWPSLGALAPAVALYGVVLAGTAATASRCTPAIAIGGAFFLASDSILAFRLFMPEAMPAWTSPLVMLTYCLGQGLLSVGVLRLLSRTEGART